MLFLAEAFTRPARLFGLARLGFTQSYTYFTWRTTKAELAEFALMHAERADECRPNLFVNTPDILHESLQTGGPAMFAIRATLASTFSPTWGVYSGYELYEWRAGQAGQRGVPALREVRAAPARLRRRGGDRQLAGAVPDPAQRDPARAPGAAAAARHPLPPGRQRPDPRLLEDRPGAPATRCWWSARWTRSTRRPATPRSTCRRSGLDWNDRFIVHDEVAGGDFNWGQFNFVRLEPWRQVAHIFRVEK